MVPAAARTPAATAAAELPPTPPEPLTPAQFTERFAEAPGPPAAPDGAAPDMKVKFTGLTQNSQVDPAF